MLNLDAKVLGRVACSLRRRSGQVEPSFSTMQIVEACFPGTLVTGRRMRPGVDETLRIDRGHNWRDGRGHRRRHVIVYNRDLSIDQQRYAIAHALGHVIFDGGVPPTGCGSFDVEREARCDRFADELLVPLDELRPYVCASPSVDPESQETYLDMIDLIASHFRAPSSLVDRRVRELQRSTVSTACAMLG